MFNSVQFDWQYNYDLTISLSTWNIAYNTSEGIKPIHVLLIRLELELYRLNLKSKYDKYRVVLI